MRELIFLLISIVLFGCNDDTKKLKSLEIMSYYYVPNEKSKKMEIDFLIYSIVDTEGKAKVLRKKEPMNKEYLSYETKIPQDLIDKISKTNLNKKEEFYNNSKRLIDLDEIYCGPIKRVQLKYKNSHQFSFIFTSDEDNKISDFALLLKSLEKPLKLITEDLEVIKKQQKFKNFTIEKDSTMLPFPPFPKLKIDEVRFVKPH